MRNCLWRTLVCAGIAVMVGVTPLRAELPSKPELTLVVGGRVIGAIGVSGNTPQEDEAIAMTGAAALERAIAAGQ